MIHVLEVTGPSLAYVILGGFAVAFSMISLVIRERLYINEVVLGTAFGVLMGPHVANVFDPRSWGSQSNVVTLEVMRVVLATGLFAIGVELPKSYLMDHAKGLLVLVVPTMAFGWLVISGFIVLLFPSLSYVSALVISACLTPTDPIISAAIIGGKFARKNVPVNLRRILAAESAANDGLAYPFLSISLYLTLESSTRAAFGKWFLIGWLYQVVLGTVLGAVLGIAFSKLMKLSHQRGYIDRESYVAQYLALALFTIGVASTIGSDDLLAAFAAGSAISWDGNFNVHTENEVFSSVVDLLLNCGCFIYIGAWLPFESFNTPLLGITPWRLIVLFIIIILLRRIPSILLLFKWIPEIDGWREALFCGHFGPMGVGAVFVSTLAISRLPKPRSPPENQAELLAATLQIIVSFVVLGSIIIHGLSISSFSFGRRIHSRTVTLTRTWTWTSRQTLAPDWLLWVRPAPGAGSGVTPGDGNDNNGRGRGRGNELGRDIEAGSTPTVVVKNDEVLEGIAVEETEVEGKGKGLEVEAEKEDEAGRVDDGSLLVRRVLSQKTQGGEGSSSGGGSGSGSLVQEIVNTTITTTTPDNVILTSPSGILISSRRGSINLNIEEDNNANDDDGRVGTTSSPPPSGVKVVRFPASQ